MSFTTQAYYFILKYRPIFFRHTKKKQISLTFVLVNYLFIYVRFARPVGCCVWRSKDLLATGEL